MSDLEKELKAQLNISIRPDIEEPKRNNKYTSMNEPYIKYENNKEYILQYPNMNNAYNNFSKTYNIPKDNFILTTGVESSLRIALSAIRISLAEYAFKTPFIYEVPEFRENTGIIAEQEGFIPIPKKFKYSEFLNRFFINDIDVQGSIYYENHMYNGLFEIFDNFIKGEPPVKIINEEYTNSIVCNFSRELLSDNTIIIGDVSKSLGCGIGLGYIIYSSKWNILMQHQRESYISPLACMHTSIRIPNLGEIAIEMHNRSKYKNDFVAVHPNFYTIKADNFKKGKDPDRISKVFEVDGIKFYTLGIDKDE
jgi:hypothetical protein